MTKKSQSNCFFSLYLGSIPCIPKPSNLWIVFALIIGIKSSIKVETWSCLSTLSNCANSPKIDSFKRCAAFPVGAANINLTWPEFALFCVNNQDNNNLATVYVLPVPAPPLIIEVCEISPLATETFCQSMPCLGFIGNSLGQRISAHCCKCANSWPEDAMYFDCCAVKNRATSFS